MKTKPLKFVIVGDSHGDMQDNVSVNALFEFMKDWKPEIRVHLGDAWDFRNLRKGASDDEKAASMQEDWEAGTALLRRFFEGGKQNHFLRGNHDERVFDLTKSATGVLRDYAREGCLRLENVIKRSKASMLPYDARYGILNLGHLKVLHGYHTGVGACRQHANIYGNAVFGHTHQIESQPVASLEPAEARSIGCLCNINMDYCNRNTGKLKWANGWIYGLLFPDGHYQLFQTRKLNEKFYAASQIKEF